MQIHIEDQVSKETLESLKKMGLKSENIKYVPDDKSA